jgi:hypothetical protein
MDCSLQRQQLPANGAIWSCSRARKRVDMEETLNMSKRHEPHQATQQSSWLEDQLTKSLFFHIKLHEWIAP